MDLASDAGLLESAFAAKDTKSTQFRSNSISNSHDRSAAAAENANKLAILEPKRANNIEIMISFLFNFIII